MPRTVGCLPSNHGEPMTSVGHLPVFIDGEQRNKVGICILPNHSSFLAWRIPWTKGVWWATVHSVAELDMTEVT